MTESVTFGAKAAQTDVQLTATVKENGHVACQLDCNGQTVGVVFTGTDVQLDLPEPAQQ